MENLTQKQRHELVIAAWREAKIKRVSAELALRQAKELELNLYAYAQLIDIGKED